MTINLKIRHGRIVDNVVTYVYAKFGDDRLWNEKALGLADRKSDVKQQHQERQQEQEQRSWPLETRSRVKKTCHKIDTDRHQRTLHQLTRGECAHCRGEVQNDNIFIRKKYSYITAVAVECMHACFCRVFFLTAVSNASFWHSYVYGH